MNTTTTTSSTTLTTQFIPTFLALSAKHQSDCLELWGIQTQAGNLNSSQSLGYLANLIDRHFSQVIIFQNCIVPELVA